MYFLILDLLLLLNFLTDWIWGYLCIFLKIGFAVITAFSYRQDLLLLLRFLQASFAVIITFLADSICCYYCIFLNSGFAVITTISRKLDLLLLLHYLSDWSSCYDCIFQMSELPFFSSVLFYGEQALKQLLFRGFSIFRRKRSVK